MVNVGKYSSPMDPSWKKSFEETVFSCKSLFSQSSGTKSLFNPSGRGTTDFLCTCTKIPGAFFLYVTHDEHHIQRYAEKNNCKKMIVTVSSHNLHNKFTILRYQICGKSRISPCSNSVSSSGRHRGRMPMVWQDVEGMQISQSRSSI